MQSCMRKVALGLAVLLLPQAAQAQNVIQTERSAFFIPLASIPGIQGVTPIAFSSRDDGSEDLTLPFTFNYLTQPFTEVTVSTNGGLGLSTHVRPWGHACGTP